MLYHKFNKCDASRDLAPFLQFKKHETHPWRSVTFSKVTGFSLKVTFLHGCFSRFLDCTNGTKSRNAPHIQWPFGFCCTIISEFINSMQCLYLLSCLFYTGSVLHISCFYIRVIIAENYMYLVKDRSCYFDFFW